MATVTIPEPLHEELRRRAEESETSVGALVVRALEERFGGGLEGKQSKGNYVTGPLIKGGERGPLYPRDENPHDLILPGCEHLARHSGPRVKRTKRVTGPMVKGEGKLGPRFPTDETPHDLILS
jgi:hypothetical protein